MPVCLCECMHMGQVSDRALNSPEPRLQAVKSHLSWVLTTKLDSFRIGNAAKLPNYLFSPFYFNYSMVRGVSFLICLCGVLNVFCIWTGNSFLNLGYFLFDSFEKHFPCLYTWVPSLFFYAYNPINLTFSEYHMYLGISTGACSLIYLWPCWSTSLSPLCLPV